VTVQQYILSDVTVSLFYLLFCR